MKLNIKNESSHPMPAYATPDSAGIDLRANLTTALLITPMERVMIPTGLKMEIPQGHVGMVCPRSGLAVKNGLTVLNAPGIVDSDFRGQIQVILINLSNEDVYIMPGDRIAQLVFVPYVKVEISSPEAELSETERKGGFGSTGVQ